MNHQIETLRAWIAESSRIVFFGGAGVSTESGIPDFRGEAGIFKAISEYGVRPEVILSHSFFVKNKTAFFDYYRKHLLYPEAKPNAAHLALAELEKRGKLHAVITQNIDDLHQRGGSENVLELHGSLYRNYCTICKRAHTLEEVLASDTVPLCKSCGSVVRPDVVLYEESLNDQVMSRAIDEIAAADMLIVGGTSLNVYPAAGLLRYYRGERLVLINKEATAMDARANLVIHAPIGEVFAQMRR